MPTIWIDRTELLRKMTDHSTASAGCDTCNMLITPIGTDCCANTINPWAAVPVMTPRITMNTTDRHGDLAELPGNTTTPSGRATTAAIGVMCDITTATDRPWRKLDW